MLQIVTIKRILYKYINKWYILFGFSSEDFKPSFSKHCFRWPFIHIILIIFIRILVVQFFDFFSGNRIFCLHAFDLLSNNISISGISPFWNSPFQELLNCLFMDHRFTYVWPVFWHHSFSKLSRLDSEFPGKLRSIYNAFD